VGEGANRPRYVPIPACVDRPDARGQIDTLGGDVLISVATLALDLLRVARA
jgi:hypothetical protein